MANNRLKLNDEKTHLLIMSTRQKLSVTNIKVKISTKNEVIKPIESEKLLGIIIQNDLKDIVSRCNINKMALNPE